MIKLVKYISRTGNISRRKSARLIKNGNIKVNGEVINQYSYKIEPENDEVKLNGDVISLNKKEYYIFYKPVGYVCSKSDKYSKTIYKYLDNKYRNLSYAGRLDKNSEGLVILTNDGDLIYKLTHPSFEINRRYKVQLKNNISNNDKSRIIEGIEDKKELLRCDKVKKIGDKSYLIDLHTGKKREIRRIFKKLGNKVEKLKRIKYAKIEIGNLLPGEIEKVKKDEIL